MLVFKLNKLFLFYYNILWDLLFYFFIKFSFLFKISALPARIPRPEEARESPEDRY